MDEHKHTQHAHTDHTLEAPKTSDPHAGHDHSGHHMPPPEPKQTASNGHEQHEKHMAHGSTGHADHHEQMVADYRKRFWIVLLLTIPVTVLSPKIMMLFGYHFEFPGAILSSLGYPPSFSSTAANRFWRALGRNGRTGRSV